MLTMCEEMGFKRITVADDPGVAHVTLVLRAIAAEALAPVP
jgi:hypothetical protein